MAQSVALSFEHDPAGTLTPPASADALAWPGRFRLSGGGVRVAGDGADVVRNGPTRNRTHPARQTGTRVFSRYLVHLIDLDLRYARSLASCMRTTSAASELPNRSASVGRMFHPPPKKAACAARAPDGRARCANAVSTRRFARRPARALSTGKAAAAALTTPSLSR